MLRTSDYLKSLMTNACGAFFDAATATISLAHPFFVVDASTLSHQFCFNVAYADLGTLLDGLWGKYSERAFGQLHYRLGGNAK